MIALVWVVREPDATRALHVGESKSEARARAHALLERYPSVLTHLQVELHDFQAACDKDWRFPRVTESLFATLELRGFQPQSHVAKAPESHTPPTELFGI